MKSNENKWKAMRNIKDIKESNGKQWKDKKNNEKQ